MWYQRTPDNCVEIAWDETGTTRSTKGWEGVSIPFEADIVTTDEKGEITHFYKKSADSGYEREYDSGHEYWLRQFTGVGTQDGNKIPASMVYLTAGKSDVAKEVKNTFLWHEKEKSERAETTKDCRKGCNGCGLHRWKGVCAYANAGGV